MTSMTRTAPAPLQHPAWCDTARCSIDMTDGYPRDVLHYSTARTFRTGAPLDEDAVEASISLTRAQNLDGADREPWPDEGVDLVSVDIDGRGVVTIDQLESFGRWLTERAAEYRAAIEAEAGR